MPIDFNKYRDVCFEKWPVKFAAVSANADGILQSAILVDGTYLWWSHSQNRYIVEK